MQLPAEFTTALELRDRVRLKLESDRIEVWPGQPHGARADAAGAAVDTDEVAAAAPVDPVAAEGEGSR
jgi:hypothetical protein